MHYVILYHVFKVVRPHTKPLSRRGAVIATLVLWTLSFTVTLPYAFNMEMSQGVCGKFCTERWTTALARRSYTMVVMFSQFALPFTLMAFCYAHIFLVLNRRAKVKLRRMDERSVALENSLPSRAHQVTERKQDETNEPMNSFLDKQEKERQRLIQQNRRMINKPWIYRSLPPRSQTEKLTDLHGPITSETLITSVTPKLKELNILKTESDVIQHKPVSEANTNTNLIEFDDSDTFV
ncbi:hypothetical protein ANCCEY_14428 [Ancylostoma ceylanicum]|uniref:G-protein coupled receptors family 1 profile domain-containing protein n=1 Tax=Ancylostoma ceylanicum TaxID=53326 RepID=A0A0D6LFP5_9BILA|nr:hypothetical protein ANCCEY_14428 [Ancylostoma ceylanicum]